MNECDIFLAALDKGDAQERCAFLDKACGGNAELRQRIEALLESNSRAGSLLEHPALGAADTILPVQGEVSTDGPANGHAPQSAPPDEIALDFLAPADEAEALGRIGPYAVTGAVGRGGMGIVVKAQDAKLNRVVAIKVLAPELATNPTARKRFIREAQAAAAVVHQHVVTIHAVDEDRLPYLVMEYIDGQSLQEKLDHEGHLEVIEILRIGQQVALGLAAAHAQGLMHRDVKPANILLENGVERVRITDFGLARAVDDVRMTKSGEVAGTPQYMSPEQAQGLPLDARSDLFSLGCVLYAMCTGRPPFRAETTVATMRRICDDTPRPIHEVNPEIPQRLVGVVNRLLAKQPADRFQSAAEVATLLSQHLAQLQNPGLPDSEARDVPRSALRTRGTRDSGSSALGRHWAIPAAALVCLLVALGLAEGTGTTQLAATVIRIFTPNGTLVVETDDPAVKVTIEGDGGLVLTGAGLEEIRLRPGSYKVQADKDGKPVPLERELVSVARGGREVIKVKLDSAPVAAKGAAPAKGAFVLINSAAERKYDTLAEAVRGASDGDTIEIRGNGPFVSQPITIQRNTLTIRAGEGFRPVIKLSPAGVGRGLPLIATNYALLLEGLELHRAPDDGGDHNRVLQVNGAVLRAANCRFRSSIWTQRIPGCVFLNCEFLSDEAGFLGQFSPGARFIHENCLHRTGGASLYLSSSGSASDEVSIQIRRSTFWSRRVSVWWSVKSPLAVASDRPQGSKPIRLDVSRSIFDTPSVLGFEQHKDFVDKAGAHAPPEAEALLLRLIRWRGERNVLPAGSTSVVWSIEGKKQPAHGPKGLEEWQQFWGAAEADPLEGRLRFQGGDLLTRTEASVDELTPDDFRLREDSPGYRAGSDGKDLGADLDLVGPGPAYERWKKTPEYQEWLKDSGQQKETAAAKPGSGAFVLQGGPGSAERKFDTLADAVQRASDGDTIEVRGNGPFLSQPIVINQALVIRAAAGYRPVIWLSQADTQSSALLHSRARLTVEGLEFQRLGQSRHPGPSRRYILFSATSSSLHVANCRFRVDNQDPKYRLVCIGAHGAASCLRNCEFLAPTERSNSINTSNKSFVLDNCLHLGQIALSLVYEQIESGAEFVLSRNTLVTDKQAIFFGVGIEAEKLASGPVANPIGLVATGNIFDVGRVLGLNEMHSRPQPLELNEAESIFRRVLDWQGQENVYRPGGRFLLNWGYGEKGRPDHGPQGLEDWKQFWSSPEAGSVEGRIRFQGGDLLARLADAPEKLTAGDFRLRPDSPGYRAGPGGKDLGADVNLVGPGQAYERWKKTPGYQDWLKETGQSNDP